ncbi:hypothetical protein D3C72_1600810 [compost metagenome]
MLEEGIEGQQQYTEDHWNADGRLDYAFDFLVLEVQAMAGFVVVRALGGNPVVKHFAALYGKHAGVVATQRRLPDQGDDGAALVLALGR